MFGIRVTQSILSETKGHQGCPGGGGLAAGTGAGRGGKARPPRPHCRACATHASAGGLPRGPKPNALPQGQAHGKATVGAKSGRPGSEPARGRGRSGRPGGDIEFARGRWKRRPGDGVATGSGIGDVLAARGRLATGSGVRVTTTRGGGGVGSRGGVGTGDFAFGAGRARAGVQARTVSTLSPAFFTSLGSRPTVCPATLRS